MSKSVRFINSATRAVYPVMVVSLLVVLYPGAVFGQRVYGKIGEKYNALGGPAGPLGRAMSDEADAPFGGRFNAFQNGYIYWSPKIGTAYAVFGAIGAKWNQSGRVEFGYPITDETPTPDGRGRFNHFRAIQVPGQPESSIYWTPESGAFLVYGEIRKAWAAAGWERSIGFPTSDEFQWGKYRRSNFERGYITWAGDEGTRLVHSGEAILRNIPPSTFASILVTGIELAIDNKPFFSNPTLLSENTMCQELDRRRGDLETLIKDTIRAKVNPRLGGFSIRSDARMEITPHCSFRADVATMGSGSVRVQTYLPDNSFTFHVTTPSVLGSWADPAFSITFDVGATAMVSAPNSPVGTFSAGPARVWMSNVRLDSHNVTGDVALALKSAYQFVTGTDLAAELTQSRAFEQPVLRSGLSDLSAQVRHIPAQYRIETTVSHGGLFRISGTGQSAPRPPVIH
jgi:LGFP repeat